MTSPKPESLFYKIVFSGVDANIEPCDIAIDIDMEGGSRLVHRNDDDNSVCDKYKIFNGNY